MLEEQQAQVINAAVPQMASRSFSKITEQIQELEIDAVLIYAGNNEHSSTMYSHCLETQSKTPTQEMLQKTPDLPFAYKDIFQQGFHRHRCCTVKARGLPV